MKSRRRQTQKLTQRRVILIGFLFLSTTTMGIFLFMYLNKPASIEAKPVLKPEIVVVNDQELINDKSIPAPVVDYSHSKSSQVLYVRKIKSISNTSTK
ncbi:MAG: hypothetical protein EYC69_03605 [Bacteroidetes bacterium]|nr:MAG: hypothetical protein EYC69_03605 [Bacteroidota bacterium]